MNVLLYNNLSKFFATEQRPFQIIQEIELSQENFNAFCEDITSNIVKRYKT